jgi:signal transduction histidine kinase
LGVILTAIYCGISFYLVLNWRFYLFCDNIPYSICFLKVEGLKMDNKKGQNTNPSQLRRDDLIAQLAHEIKNPLSVIKINLQLIAEDLEKLKSPEQAGSRPSSRLDNQTFNAAQRKISVIKKEADRLEQILDGFLRYTDKIELQTADIDLNELISDIIDFYTPQAYSRSIVVRQNLHTEPLFCRLDSNLLKQALLNLFINAQQAMPDGGELMIRTRKAPKYAIIQVNDTGTGIQPEKLEKVFNGFSTRPNGKGLGLPTAKKIIEAHKGTITVESEPGKGSIFTIKLPLQKTAKN